MEDFSELVKTLKAYDWGQSGAPLLAVDAEIRKVLGHPERMAKVEEALLDVLRSGAATGAKRGVCKSLSLIASDRSVATLAAMLAGAETSDMARYVLERMPAGAADAALREALPKASGRARTGIVNSLGNRRDAQAVMALGALLEDGDEATAQAAAWALGRIGGNAAVLALARHRETARARVRAEVLDAYLVCARRLSAEGKTVEAAAMYRELSGAGAPAAVRKAAERGLKAGSR
jgi:HEAT repeat protein